MEDGMKMFLTKLKSVYEEVTVTVFPHSPVAAAPAGYWLPPSLCGTGPQAPEV